jgi:hypothetical protein
MSSGGFSANPHHQDHSADSLDSGRLATIFARLKPPGLLYVARSAGESPGDTSCQFGHPAHAHSYGTVPASGAIHLQDLLLILSYHCLEAVVVENGAYIELMSH